MANRLEGEFAILREDVFRDPNVTLISTFTEDSASPESRLRDDVKVETWLPNSATTGTEDYTADFGSAIGMADTLAILKHNLGSQGVTARAQWGAGYTDGLVISPADDSDIFLPLTTVPGSLQRYFRLRLTGVTTATYIGEVLYGRRITFPLRNVPDGFNPRDGSRAAPGMREIRGAPLTIERNYRGREIHASFRFLTDAWLQADTNLSEYRYWLRNSARLGEPFLTSWAFNTGTYLDSDMVWGVLDGMPKQRRQTHIQEGTADMLAGRNELSLSIRGI